MNTNSMRPSIIITYNWKVINKTSVDADLTIVGYKSELIKKHKEKLFNGYENLGNVMFVNSRSEKEIINTKEWVK